jgi:hypothetical protein
MAITTTTRISDARVAEMEYGDYDRFLAITARGTKPVVINGALDDWKALGSWNADYFRSRFGEESVRVNSSRDGVCRGDPTLGFSHVSRQILLKDFLDTISPTATPAERYYLQLLPLRGPFAELLDEISIPRFIRSTSAPGIYLWVGAAGNGSALHFDESYNLLAQVRGRKRLVLFPPEQTDCLYPFPADSKIPTMSQVDIDRPDFDTFPRFREAEGVELTLQEGQMLYIPLFWWHQVRSLDPSISVNFWWMPPDRQM